MILEDISREPELGLLRLSVRIGSEASKRYLAESSEAGETQKWANLDDKLFFRLSNLAFERYSNSTIYHVELLRIILAYAAKEPIPSLPIELGTSCFAPKIPSRLRIMCDRIRVPLRLAWKSWKFRKARSHGA